MTRECRFTTAFLISIALIFPKLLLSQFTVEPMLVNGPTDKRLNIVFLSEGYIASELDKFGTDATSALNHLLDTQPFKEYGSYFNAYRINVISNESGSDHPGTASDEFTCPGCPVFFADTYFNSTYDSFAIHRLLTIPPNDIDPNSANGADKVNSLLQNLFPEYDIVFIVVNHDLYGGSGGTFSIFSTNFNAAEIAVHELGHSFAGLGDEV